MFFLSTQICCFLAWRFELEPLIGFVLELEALLLMGKNMPVCLYWLGFMLKLAYSTVESLGLELVCDLLFRGWWELKDARRFWLDALKDSSRFCNKFEADDRDVDKRSKLLGFCGAKLWVLAPLIWNGNFDVCATLVVVGFWTLWALFSLLLQFELEEEDSLTLSMSKSETLWDLRCCCCSVEDFLSLELFGSCEASGLLFAWLVCVWIEGRVLGNKRGRLEVPLLAFEMVFVDFKAESSTESVKLPFVK